MLDGIFVLVGLILACGLGSILGLIATAIWGFLPIGLVVMVAGLVLGWWLFVRRNE